MSGSTSDSFHGTAISIIQQPTAENPGQEQERTHNKEKSRKQPRLTELPTEYTHVPPLTPLRKDLTCPSKEILPHPESASSPVQSSPWLNFVNDKLNNGSNQQDFCTWAAYHSQRTLTPPKPPAITSMLPLFEENVNSPAMLNHGIGQIVKTTDHVNPGQTPVITMDQPVYASSKLLQWTYPDTHGENKMVLVLGGLHIEVSFMKLIGH
jgi:hypothetical protein